MFRRFCYETRSGNWSESVPDGVFLNRAEGDRGQKRCPANLCRAPFSFYRIQRVIFSAGKGNGNGCPLTDLASKIDICIVTLGRVFDNGQAESGSAGFL